MSLYFTYSPLTANTVARAADLNTRFNGVSAGFDLLPAPSLIAEDRVTYGADTGTANAYLVAPTIPITAYNTGLRIRLKALNANTGASTINVSGLGVKQITRSDGTVLILGDIVANQILDLTYDGTAFRLAMAFAEMSPAGVATKLAAAGTVTVSALTTAGSVTATSFINNGQTLDGMTAFGVSFMEAANASAGRTLLSLGTMALETAASYALLASPTFTGTPVAPTAAPGTNTTQIATTAYVTAAISGVSGFAPIADPTFTGDPKAPTPATADNDTSIATTAYVKANLTSYLTTATATATYAPLASPALTGTPTAPTAALSTNTTQIATTAFVLANSVSTNSPAFTGTPTAPTPSTGTNTTQLATTAYVQANLVNYATTASLSSYAPLASPGLTGTPTAPTAAANTNTTQLATTAFVTTADNLKAPLASPTFTGTPAAPTAAAATNTTQIATTAFVQTAVGGVSGFAPINSPAFTGDPTAPTPATADNDTSIATTAYVKTNLTSYVTTTTADATYAPKASPTFTGTPAAPTAAGGTNTTQIATTAFVIANGAPLASPAFTGNPTAPTPSTADNDTSIATTAYVQANLASYVLTSTLSGYLTTANAATTYAPLASPALTGTPTVPTAAAATNNTTAASTAFVHSQNYITSSALSPYAPLASPGLTGVPTAPTAAEDTNSTQVATTAFVDRLRDVPRVTGALSRGKVFATSSGATFGAANAGETYTVYNDSAAAITLTASGITMRLAGTATTGNRTLAARGIATVWYNSGSEAIVSGNVT